MNGRGLLRVFPPLFIVLMDSYRVKPCAFKQSGRNFLRLSMLSASQNAALEVEQKFALNDGGSNVQRRLTELGFTKKGEIDMVDWYFDTPEPNWVLTTQDCWLRCRQTDQGSKWELKRGRRHQGGATVYEELEGEEAIEASISMLPKMDSTMVVPDEYEGYAVPKLPWSAELLPFARIETHRSSWTFSGESELYSGLVVDLDGTQYGYMVGEVEAVVYNESDIPMAQERISSLVRIISPKPGKCQESVGKLEHYLIRCRPEHYKACVESGSIQNRKS